MLARTEMSVVFVPGEVISQGSRAIARLTAGKMPKSFGIWHEYLESATVTEPSQKWEGWNEVNPASEKPK
jgi:hypothetical protein